MLEPANEDGEIWDRLKSEPSKAYASFCIYRDMLSSRTIERVVSEIDKRIEGDIDGYSHIPLSTLLNFSSKWQWVERAEAYDDYLDENFRTKHEKRIIEMRIRQADNAKAWQDEILEIKDKFSDITKVKDKIFKTPGGLAWFHSSLMTVYGQACMIEQDALLTDNEGNDEVDEQKRREEFVRLFKETEEDEEQPDNSKDSESV